MARSKPKANGKRRPLVVDRSVESRGDLTVAVFMPKTKVRETSNVLEVLSEASEWLFATMTMLEAKAPESVPYTIVYDVARAIDACVEALREGHAPRFRFDPGELSPGDGWHEAARRVLAWEDPSDGAAYQLRALEKILDVLEHERGWVAEKPDRAGRGEGRT